MTLTRRLDEPAREPAAGLNAVALHTELRRRGFDMRRSVSVTYLVGTGTDREAAYVMRRRAAADGWQATLYGDRSGWVVRLSRIGLAQLPLLVQDCRYVEDLTRPFGGQVRGVDVEDVHLDDLWDTLAARLEAGQPAPGPSGRFIPLQRRSGRDHDPSLTRTA
ncbi:MAG: hypothetical protein WCD35_08975 [Mycobacteriales bacterium]